MSNRKLLHILACVVVLCMALTLFTDDAVAQGDKEADNRVRGADKDLSQKRGFEALSNAPVEGGSKMPSKFEMGIGIGSVFVMIAVMKYL